jgi:hypothetical protein
MKSNNNFLYCRDPIFIVCLILYFINLFIVEPLTINYFTLFNDYFNDFICIPFWLPPTLWLNRKLKIRQHDLYPTTLEIVLHLVTWSCLFEWICPLFPEIFPHTTGDNWDIIAYTLGSIVAYLLWNYNHKEKSFHQNLFDI